MSTALTVAQQAKKDLEALLALDPHALDAMVGEGILEPEDLRIFPARIKIAHKKDSDSGAEAGEFFNVATGEVYGKSIEFVVLFPMKATRVEYFRPYTKDAPPYCASDDGINPRENTERRPLQAAQPGPCKGCSQASWKDEDGNDRPRGPLCTRQRNFMLAVKSEVSGWDKGTLMLMKSRKPAADRLTELFIRAGLRRGLVATTKFVEGDSGDYFVPVFGIGRKLDNADILELFDMRRGSKQLYDEGGLAILADEGDDGNGSVSAAFAPAGEGKHDGGALPEFFDAEPAGQPELPDF